MKLTYLTSAIALGALLAGFTSSCSDNDVPEPSQTVEMTINGKLVDATRAEGDDEAKISVNEIKYAVYENTVGGENGGLRLILTNAETTNEAAQTNAPTAYLSGNSFTLNLSLIANTSYTFIFWADWADNDTNNRCYTLNADTGELTIDYTKMAINSTKGDAFSGTIAKRATGGSINITLTRPLAEINIGSTDASGANSNWWQTAEGASSSMTVTNVANTLNLLTGKVSSTITEAVFPQTPLTELVGIKYPVLGYYYLCRAYVLANDPGLNSDTSIVSGDNDTEVVDNTKKVGITINYFDSENNNNPVTNTLTDVPIGANLRTNIYGLFVQKPININGSIDNPNQSEATINVDSF